MKLRIVTLNTWKNEGAYGLRLESMARGLRVMMPDVVALQECFRCEETGEDTAAFLARRLGYGLVYAPARRKLRMHGGRERWSESGLAILSRYPMEDVSMLRLPSSDVGGERVALLAELETARFPMGFGCIHFSHIQEEGELRRRQLESSLRAMERMRLRGPCALAGDFNCVPRSEEAEAAVRAWGGDCRNALPCLGEKAGTSPNPGLARGERRSRQVDQLWLLDPPEGRGEAEFGLLDGGICLAEPDPEIDQVPSDHAGVWVDVALVPRWASG